jgi:hypothetical protein
MHFYAKLLLKWVYQVSIPYSDISSIDKKYDSVSGVFNNSILVSTDKEKYFFASFVNRDETFGQIQRLLENKSAHKTIPMTSFVPKKNDFLGHEERSEREAWGEGSSHSDAGSLVSSSSSLDSMEKKKNNFVSSLESRQKNLSASRDSANGILPDGSKQDFHRRSQSEDLDIRHTSQESQLSVASRRRASLNALSRPKPGFEEDTPGSSPEKDHTRESSLKRADTMVAKTDLISSHSPDLGLIEIARSRDGAVSTDGSFRTASPGPSPSKSHIVHQTKHIIHTVPSPSPSGSLKSFETHVSREPAQIVPAPHVQEETAVDDHVEEEGVSDAEEPIPHPKRSDHPHPVNCTCHKEHTEMKLMLDHTFDTSVETVWETLFGSKLQESDFCIKFWGMELKYRDIRMTNWKTGTEELEEEPCLTQAEQSLRLEDVTQGHHRRLSYTVPSSNPLGPREIKTLVYNQVLFKDHQNHFICVMQTTRTPLVPAGDCFDVKIKTCISHQGPNKTLVKVSCRVNFVKSSWIRIAIERAVPDTLRDYYGKLKASLETFIREEAKQKKEKEVVASPGSVSSTLRRKPKMPARGGTPVFLDGSQPSEVVKESEFTSHPLESELQALKKEEETSRALKEKRDLADGSISSSQQNNTAIAQVEGGIFSSYVNLWHRHQPWLLPTLVTILLLLALVNTLLLNAMVRTLAEIHHQQPSRHGSDL